MAPPAGVVRPNVRFSTLTLLQSRKGASLHKINTHGHPGRQRPNFLRRPRENRLAVPCPSQQAGPHGGTEVRRRCPVLFELNPGPEPPLRSTYHLGSWLRPWTQPGGPSPELSRRWREQHGEDTMPCGRQGSNLGHPHLQCGALPLSYTRFLNKKPHVRRRLRDCSSIRPC